MGVLFDLPSLFTLDTMRTCAHNTNQAFRSLHLQQHLEAIQELSNIQAPQAIDTGSVGGSTSNEALHPSPSTATNTAAAALAALPPTSAMAVAAAAAQSTAAASIVDGVLFQCDQAERKCKLGRLTRSPVSITIYIPPPTASASVLSSSSAQESDGGFAYDNDVEADEKEEGEGQQQRRVEVSREDFLTLASTSPEALITLVRAHCVWPMGSLGLHATTTSPRRSLTHRSPCLALTTRDGTNQNRWRVTCSQAIKAWASRVGLGRTCGKRGRSTAFWPSHAVTTAAAAAGSSGLTFL